MRGGQRVGGRGAGRRGGIASNLVAKRARGSSSDSEADSEAEEGLARLNAEPGPTDVAGMRLSVGTPGGGIAITI